MRKQIKVSKFSVCMDIAGNRENKEIEVEGQWQEQLRH